MLDDTNMDSEVGSDCSPKADAMNLAQPKDFQQGITGAQTFNSDHHNYHMEDEPPNPWAASASSLRSPIKSTSLTLKERSARAARGHKDAVLWQETHAPPPLPTDGSLVPEPSKGHGRAGYHTGWYLNMNQAQWKQIIVSVFIICVTWHCLIAHLTDQRLQACREAS
jgi:hypothetical protein